VIDVHALVHLDELSRPHPAPEVVSIRTSLEHLAARHDPRLLVEERPEV
jgi:hypothetical protein